MKSSEDLDASSPDTGSIIGIFSTIRCSSSMVGRE
jgi:hypothetical protein